MPAMTIIMEGDGCWPDLPSKNVIELMGADAPPIQVAVLEAGMESGKPSVSLRLDLPDGSVLLTETSALLFCTAARAITSKYPGLFADG